MRATTLEHIVCEFESLCEYNEEDAYDGVRSWLNGFERLSSVFDADGDDRRGSCMGAHAHLQSRMARTCIPCLSSEPAAMRLSVEQICTSVYRLSTRDKSRESFQICGNTQVEFDDEYELIFESVDFLT